MDKARIVTEIEYICDRNAELEKHVAELQGADKRAGVHNLIYDIGRKKLFDDIFNSITACLPSVISREGEGFPWCECGFENWLNKIDSSCLSAQVLMPIVSENRVTLEDIKQACRDELKATYDKLLARADREYDYKVVHINGGLVNEAF